MTKIELTTTFPLCERDARCEQLTKQQMNLCLHFVKYNKNCSWSLPRQTKSRKIISLKVNIILVHLLTLVYSFHSLFDLNDKVITRKVLYNMM